VRRTVPLSAEIEQRIDGLLATGMAGEDPQWVLSELARLGARSIIRRAVEEEFDAWLGRSRYERLSGSRAGIDAQRGCRLGDAFARALVRASLVQPRLDRLQDGRAFVAVPLAGAGPRAGRQPRARRGGESRARWSAGPSGRSGNGGGGRARRPRPESAPGGPASRIARACAAAGNARSRGRPGARR
jgi:hypothetical protein